MRSRMLSIALACAPALAAAQGDTTQKVPFSKYDWTWLNGNPRTRTFVFDSKPVTGEFRIDVNYVADFNKPRDHTLVGTSELGRTQEVQVQQIGIGGDLHHEHVIGRLMTQFGMYSTMTPRNDASPARGQWQLDDAYRYISEAWAGYHWNKWYGINLESGIFMSYVGLFSYYNFDNWAYQPSYVSSNTPWFFNGMRLQIYPTENLKIEPWLINGWQSYGMFNEAPGAGMQVLYRPTANVSLLSNNYYGADWLGIKDRWRMHSDNSVQVKYYEDSTRTLNRSAFSLTLDIGCENGAGVTCRGGSAATPAQYFVGAMAYNRFSFRKDRYGLTLSGGFMENPGRYLVLMPPINGATAYSGTPYFTANPGDDFHAWDASATWDYMPDQWVTFRAEYNYRAANVPYFAGPGGVTPPGGNTGAPGSEVFVNGTRWEPDLRKHEQRMTFAMLLKM
ncbi:MAG: outer membrane beta-barrel protein [Gemmatimonadota bacterium]|nr:outer membrane beta-barrel protein [Gemmatimonadota bacterium]